ncbi:MAG: MATE family efflux transporter [Oscillospiraceae bacterium]
MTQLTNLIHRETPLSRKEQLGIVMALAFPSIVEQIMITMMQYIDTAMVGTLGANATASIGVVTTTIWLFNGFLGAAGVGFSVQVAQYLGAKKSEDARSVVRQAVLFNIVFGLFIGVLAFGLSFFLPQLLGADASIAKDASAYFAIVGLSLPLLLTQTLFASILRATGDTKTPMRLNILICVLDIIFNYFLIYPTRNITVLGMDITMHGAGLGVAGAALGSALAVGVVAVLFLIVIYKKETPIRISLTDKYRFSKSCLRHVSAIGVPVALERATLSIAQIVMTVLIANLGTVSIAANHLAVTAEALSYLPAYGVAAAATTLVGQAIGANREDLAISFAWLSTRLGMLIMTGTGVLLFLFAPQLISIFTPDADVIMLGSRVLRVEAFAQPLFAASIVATGALRGAGDSKVPFYINLISMWGVRITAALLLAPRVGLLGVWIAMCAELCIRGIIFLWRLKSKKWLHAHRI